MSTRIALTITFIALLAAHAVRAPALAGQSASGASGSYLRATIDGKPWSATEVVPDKYWSELLQIQGSEGSTSLWVQINQPTAAGALQPLKPTDLNYYRDDKFNMFMLTAGEAQVTKLDAQWVEGTFHFNGADKRSKKSVAVTNGAFRVPRPKK
jgi:hypothetical protein